MTCANIVNLLTYQFKTVFHFLHSYTYLTVSDIVECLNYCGQKRCIDDQPINYCCGCTLDDRPEEPPALFLDNDFSRMYEVRNVDGYAYMGTKEEYEKDLPQDMWELAEDLLNGTRNR